MRIILHLQLRPVHLKHFQGRMRRVIWRSFRALSRPKTAYTHSPLSEWVQVKWLSFYFIFFTLTFRSAAASSAARRLCPAMKWSPPTHSPTASHVAGFAASLRCAIACPFSCHWSWWSLWKALSIARLFILPALASTSVSKQLQRLFHLSILIHLCPSFFFQSNGTMC